MSSPSFFAPATRRSVRSAPFSAATAATSAVGSIASAAVMPTPLARSRLEAKQASGVFTEDLALLALVQVVARADGRDGVRILRIEVRIVARHQDVVFPNL